MMTRLVRLSWVSCLLSLVGCESGPEVREFASEPLEDGERATFVLRPTNQSFIRCEMFLPADWDGRFWSVGNGGWADMFCPLENAGRKPYYCVDGDMRDSWKYLPRDTIMVPWMNGRDDVKATKWLMDHGFRCIAGGYYNRPDLSHDIAWRDACKSNPLFLGMMFMTWGGVWADGGYYDLEAYGDMVNGRERR